jgi:hypothetical protein
MLLLVTEANKKLSGKISEVLKSSEILYFSMKR